MDSICAIVVSYNRKYALLECITALFKQTRPIQAIYLVDNGSTDGTHNLLFSKGYINCYPPCNLSEPWEHTTEIKNLRDSGSISFHYIRMHKNLGGAGGFYEGLKRAYERGYNWLWLMDDDCVVEADSLEKLIKARKNLEDEGFDFSFLSSLVYWTDGSLHRMNMPDIVNDLNILSKTSKYGLIPVRTASFVSFFLNRVAVEENGLPCADFFIWNDDYEYSARLSKKSPGFLVLESKVVHNTSSNYTPLDGVEPERFYFEVRNKLWIIIHSNAFYRREKIRILWDLIANIYYFLKRKRFSLISVVMVLKAILHGILSKPKCWEKK